MPSLPREQRELPAHLIAQAAANPGGSIAEIDGTQISDPNGYVPPEAITGVFLVGPDGRATGEYIRNPNAGPIRDDFGRLERADHWLGWLPGAPAVVVRDSVANLIDEQVAGAVLEWMKIVDEPVFLTGAKRGPDGVEQLILVRAGMALPFALAVRAPSGQRDVLLGAFTWVIAGLDGRRSAVPGLVRHQYESRRVRASIEGPDLRGRFVRLIAVFGAAPGIGKSSLCSALARRSHRTASVSSTSRKSTSSAVPNSRRSQRNSPTTARSPRRNSSMRPSAISTMSDADVVVMDALIPYVPTLLALGYDQPSIDRIIDDAGRTHRRDPDLFVFLDGDPAAALTRAIARERPGWIDAYGAKLARYGLTQADPDVGAMCAYLRRERDEMLRTVRRQAWDLCLIPDATSLTAGEILQLVEGSWKAGVAEHPRMSINGRVWLPFGQDPAKTQP